MIITTAEFYPFVLSSDRGGNGEAEYAAMIETLSRIARQSIVDRTYHVALALGAANTTAAERKIVSRLLNEIPEKYVERTIATFILMPNAIVRSMLTALRWLTPVLVSVEPVATIDEALKAGLATLRRHGISVQEPTIDGARRWLETESAWSSRADATTV